MNILNYLGIGTGHLDNNGGCQDHADYRIYKESGDFILALSDGCSGCESPREAAEQNVRAVMDFYDRMPDLSEYEYGELTSWDKLELIKHIRFFLADKAKERNQTDLDALAATLLFAVKRGDRLLIGHIGDGCIFALKKDKEKPFAASLPENGASSSETFFTNDVNAIDHLSLHLYDAADLRNVIMFSDGPQSLFMTDTVEGTEKNIFTVIGKVRNGEIDNCTDFARYIRENVYGYPFLLNDDWSILLYDSEGEPCEDKITEPDKMYYRYLLRYLNDDPEAANYTHSRLKAYEAMYPDIPAHIYDPSETTVPAAEPEATEPEAESEATVPTAEPEATVPAAEPETTVPTAEQETTVPAAKPEATVPAAEPEATVPAAEPETTVPTAEPETTVPTAEPEATVPTAEPEATEPMAQPEETETTPPAENTIVGAHVKDLPKTKENTNADKPVQYDFMTEAYGSNTPPAPEERYDESRDPRENYMDVITRPNNNPAPSAPKKEQIDYMSIFADSSARSKNEAPEENKKSPSVTSYVPFLEKEKDIPTDTADKSKNTVSDEEAAMISEAFFPVEDKSETDSPTREAAQDVTEKKQTVIPADDADGSSTDESLDPILKVFDYIRNYNGEDVKKI